VSKIPSTGFFRFLKNVLQNMKISHYAKIYTLFGVKRNLGKFHVFMSTINKVEGLTINQLEAKKQFFYLNIAIQAKIFRLLKTYLLYFSLLKFCSENDKPNESFEKIVFLFEKFKFLIFDDLIFTSFVLNHQPLNWFIINFETFQFFLIEI
jgi:hypothetical protein